MSTLPSLGPQRTAKQSLSPRLEALAEMLRIGRARQGQVRAPADGQEDGPGFSGALLDDAELVLKRAGERLRLSSNHTVIALAGGTGSGKSTLFNALSGATFSPPGCPGPTTRTGQGGGGGCRAPPRSWTGSECSAVTATPGPACSTRGSPTWTA